MEKADEILKMLQDLLKTRANDTCDDEDESEGGLPNWALITLLEAISIIVEKCDTTEERVAALERIQASIRT